jgi:thiamine phosphate synthase YjbQ (UPF0047 family)
MHRLIVKTHKKREIIDITQKLEAILWKNYADKTGICQLNLLHTTAALTTADLDPGTDLDMLDAFDLMVGLAVESGLLLLGTWQRVVLVELDGPREREMVVAMIETV